MRESDMVMRVVILTMVMAAFALGAAGCGSNGEGGGPTAEIKSVPTTSRALPSQAGAPAARPKRSSSRPKLPRRLVPRTTPADRARERALRQMLQRVPTSQRTKATRQVAQIMFVHFGFTTPKLEVGPAGKSVHAVMSKGQACTASPDTERNLQIALAKAIPWVRFLQVVVGGTGQPLSDYVRANCRPVELPGGSGRVVLTQEGTQFAKTKTFTVHSNRWTLEYVNGGRLLHVFVMEGGLPSGPSFRAVRRSAGRHVFTGAGTFSIQVGGSGEWRIRVRDAA